MAKHEATVPIAYTAPAAGCRDTVDKLRSFWYAYKGGASPQAPPGSLPQVCCCVRLDLHSLQHLGGLRRQVHGFFRCPNVHLHALRTPVKRCRSVPVPCSRPRRPARRSRGPTACAPTRAAQRGTSAS